MALDTAQSVREIVQQHPAAVPVFEAHGIDYCCGGGKIARRCVQQKEGSAGSGVIRSCRCTCRSHCERRWPVDDVTPRRT